MVPWTTFVSEFGPLVYRTALRIVGQAADAEDVVQDVMLEVHRLWRDRKVESWEAVLRTLATRRALDRLRQRRGEQPLPLAAIDSRQNDAASGAVIQELLEHLRRAIARLPPQQAEVFSLVYLEQQSTQDIAAALGISPHAVSVALHKARTRLEAELEPWLSTKET